MAETPSCFFKVILAPTIEDKKLSIPPKFVRNFGDELSSVARIRVPNGYIWRVDITRDEGKIWFDDGWQEFMEYHLICVGHFVVFQYEKNSNFRVHIFDTTTCEIQYPCRNMCTPSQKNWISSRCNTNQKCTATVCSSKFKSGCEMRGKKCRMEDAEVKDESESVNDSMKAKVNTTGLSNSQQYVRPKMHLSETPCQWVQETDHLIDNTKLKKAKHKVKNERHAYIVDKNEFIASLEDLGVYICDSRIFLSVEERHRAISAAKFFNPKNPSFLVLIRENNICKQYVYVPVAFSQNCLRGNKFTVLDSDGTELTVTTNWTKKCFLNGWGRFFRENDVKKGDILFFELMKKDLVMKVSVFHARV